MHMQAHTNTHTHTHTHTHTNTPYTNIHMHPCGLEAGPLKLSKIVRRHSEKHFFEQKPVQNKKGQQSLTFAP